MVPDRTPTGYDYISRNKKANSQLVALRNIISVICILGEQGAAPEPTSIYRPANIRAVQRKCRYRDIENQARTVPHLVAAAHDPGRSR